LLCNRLPRHLLYGELNWSLVRDPSADEVALLWSRWVGAQKM